MALPCFRSPLGPTMDWWSTKKKLIIVVKVKNYQSGDYQGFFIRLCLQNKSIMESSVNL